MIPNKLAGIWHTTAMFESGNVHDNSFIVVAIAIKERYDLQGYTKYLAVTMGKGVNRMEVFL